MTPDEFHKTPFGRWSHSKEGAAHRLRIMQPQPSAEELLAALSGAFDAGVSDGANDALKKLKKKLDEAALRKHQHALEHQGPGAYGHVRGLRHAEELVKAMLEEKS